MSFKENTYASNPQRRLAFFCCCLGPLEGKVNALVRLHVF